MEFASLAEIWGPTTQPSKSKGRKQSGGKEQDDFSKQRNVDMRVRPAPPVAEYTNPYPPAEPSPYVVSAPMRPYYEYNRFHGQHLGAPSMGYRCPHCTGRPRWHRRREDTELQRMTMYLCLGILVTLLYDIGTRK